MPSSSFLISEEYRWEKLYLAEAGAYRQCLDSTIRFGMGDDKRTYAQSGTKFKSTASASVHALKEISNLHENTRGVSLGNIQRTEELPLGGPEL